MIFSCIWSVWMAAFIITYCIQFFVWWPYLHHYGDFASHYLGYLFRWLRTQINESPNRWIDFSLLPISQRSAHKYSCSHSCNLCDLIEFNKYWNLQYCFTISYTYVRLSFVFCLLSFLSLCHNNSIFKSLCRIITWGYKNMPQPKIAGRTKDNGTGCIYVWADMWQLRVRSWVTGTLQCIRK